MFCQARLAVVRANYESASQLFQEVVTAAQSPDNILLRQHSQVWLAYCHSLLGNYTLAHKLADDVLQISQGDDALYASALFVHGLIAANVSTMAEAADFFEQARVLALQARDEWIEARCCANLAAVCVPQGLMEHAGRMIHRVERLNSEGVRYPQQLMQVYNIQVYRLRLMGELEEALRAALPLPEDQDDGSIHHRGWLALTTAAVATDAGDFALAEQAWQRAAALIDHVQDGALINAELLWERAWLRFRQNRLDEAHQDISRALYLSESQADIEHLHAIVIAALIDLERDDLAFVGHNLIEVCNRFRAIKHDVGLASVLLHIAAYHLRGQHQCAARMALAEALTLLHDHRLHGAFYWHPPMMVTLCKIAIQEDWGDQTDLLIAHPPLKDMHTAQEHFYLVSNPNEVLGDFAASLAARRLAVDHWEQFVPLLNDQRAQVRRRAAQVLRAAKSTAALARLDVLRHDLDPHLRQWYTQYVVQRQSGIVTIYSFGRFEILIAGQPLRLQNAGSRKARALLGALLLAGRTGLSSGDLALLLWPHQSEKKQQASLQTTISALRSILKDALCGDTLIMFDSESRRYALPLRPDQVWWDWDRLRQIAAAEQRGKHDPRLSQEAVELYHESFMEDFLALLPQPQGLDDWTARRWNSTYDTIVELVEEHEGLAATWMEAFAPALPEA